MSSEVRQATVLRKLNKLRDLIRSEGTPAIQQALDDCEDYWTRLFDAGCKIGGVE